MLLWGSPLLLFYPLGGGAARFTGCAAGNDAVNLYIVSYVSFESIERGWRDGEMRERSERRQKETAMTYIR